MDPAFVRDSTHLNNRWYGLSNIQLVYDIDSDRTIAFGPGVSVYDAAANTWTRRGAPNGRSMSDARYGAVYDPLSGLVLVQFADRTLLAYDVDADTWTEIGIVVEEREVRSEGQTQTHTSSAPTRSDRTETALSGRCSTVTSPPGATSTFWSTC